MTAILCTVRGGTAFLGADSRVTINGWSFQDDAEKIVTRGAWAFAVSGCASREAWLRYAAPEQEPDEADDAYVYRLMVAMGSDPATKQAEVGHVFAIAHGGAWRAECSPAHVARVSSAIGGGDATAAVAALLVARDHLAHDEPAAIRRAIRACASINPGVGGAVVVVACDASDGPQEMHEPYPEMVAARRA